MRITRLFGGIAALLAFAAACQACGPVVCPQACQAQAPTAADLGKPPCCDVPGATCCVRVTKAATGTRCRGEAKCGAVVLAPGEACVCFPSAGSPGCCVIKMADGKACCVPCVTRTAVLKDGPVRACSVAVPTGKPTIEGSLAKLEGLKAKQAEIEAEVKKEQAVLKRLLEELHKRVNKVGVGGPAVPPSGAFVPLPPAHQVPGTTAPRGPYGYSAPLAPTPAPSNPAPFNSAGPVPYGTQATPSPMYPVVAPHYGATSSTPPGPSAPPSPGR